MERVQSLSCWTHVTDLRVRTTDDCKQELGLGDGRTNHNFIVDADGRRFFVRIGADLPAFGVTRAREHAATRAAGAAGFGAAVHHTELPDALVVDFVNGRTLTVEQVRAAAQEGGANQLLTALTTAVRKLHSTPPPTELIDEGAARSWAPPDLVRWLALANDAGYSRLPILSEAAKLLPELEASAGPAGEPAFCHFDLLADNFVQVDCDGAAIIVDFEYAAVGQPLMDLAILSMGCSLLPAQEYNLLASYLGAAPDSATLHSFKALQVLGHLRETMWGVVAEVSGTSALTLEEAQQYADDNYAQFKHCLGEYGAGTL